MARERTVVVRQLSRMAETEVLTGILLPSGTKPHPMFKVTISGTMSNVYLLVRLASHSHSLRKAYFLSLIEPTCTSLLRCESRQAYHFWSHGGCCRRKCWGTSCSIMHHAEGSKPDGASLQGGHNTDGCT